MPLRQLWFWKTSGACSYLFKMCPEYTKWATLPWEASGELTKTTCTTLVHCHFLNGGGGGVGDCLSEK